MDGEQIKYLNAEQAGRYKELEDVFGRAGWKAIETYFKKEADEAVVRGAFANTWEANRTELGIRLACLKIASLRVSTEREFEELAETAKDAQLKKDEAQFE